MALRMPPPEPANPEPSARLPSTSDLLIFIEPWLTIPPPLAAVAVLLSTSVLFRVASPPFAMPPAAIGGPSPGCGTEVAVLPSTWLLFNTSSLVPGGLPPLPLPLAMPPPLRELFPLTRLLLSVTEPARF